MREGVDVRDRVAVKCVNEKLFDVLLSLDGDAVIVLTPERECGVLESVSDELTVPVVVALVE